MINAPITFIIGFIATGVVTGLLGASELKKRQQLRLMTRLGAPDYETAVQMQRGKFTDFATYQQALAEHITNQDDYEFMKELKEED